MRIVQQPVFIGCLLSLTVPVPICLIHIWGCVTHTSTSLSKCNLNSNPESDVNSPPSLLLPHYLGRMERYGVGVELGRQVKGENRVNN